MPELKEELIQNVVDLQDVLSNLAIKIDDLTQQISKLLILFEASAKSFQESRPEPIQDHELLKAVQMLLDQNKVIAKGISIIEERIRPPPVSSLYQPKSYPPPKFANSKSMTPSLNLSSQKPAPIDLKKSKPLPTQNG